VLSKTREHGTIIMTIENLHKKLQDDGKDCTLYTGKEEQVQRNNTEESIDDRARRAKEKLNKIEEFAELFDKFKQAYEGPIIGDDKADKDKEKYKSYLHRLLSDEKAWAG
jgi:hypothetical protein